MATPMEFPSYSTWPVHAMPSPRPRAVRTELDTVDGVEQAAGDSSGLTLLPVSLWEDDVDRHPTGPAEVTFVKQTPPRWQLFGSEESCTTGDVLWSLEKRTQGFQDLILTELPGGLL